MIMFGLHQIGRLVTFSGAVGSIFNFDQIWIISFQKELKFDENRAWANDPNFQKFSPPNVSNLSDIKHFHGLLFRGSNTFLIHVSFSDSLKLSIWGIFNPPFSFELYSTARFILSFEPFHRNLKNVSCISCRIFSQGFGRDVKWWTMIGSASAFITVIFPRSDRLLRLQSLSKRFIFWRPSTKFSWVIKVCTTSSADLYVFVLSFVYYY